MPYKHLFFDLDHTLWDHRRNADETLKDLYHDYQFTKLWDFTPENFIDTFHFINHQLWDRYHQGVIDQQFIRTKRFPLVLSELGVDASQLPQGLAEEYLERCPRKPHLMPNALETLEYLYDHYPMSIITNGFSEIQDTKMSCSGLDRFFHVVITSEQAGQLKPHPQIFHFALQQVNQSQHDCVMIGDNPVTDIEGAQASGMAQVYYDPQDLNQAPQATHRVDDLLALKELL